MIILFVELVKKMEWGRWFVLGGVMRGVFLVMLMVVVWEVNVKWAIFKMPDLV